MARYIPEMKLAVFLPNWVGDVVMATPTLQALRSHLGPDASFIGVMRPGVTDVLGGTRWFDRQFLYQPRSKNPRLTSRNLVRCLRQEKLDSVLLLTNSLRTGILGWLSGARQRVGYAHYGRGPLLTEKIRFKKNVRCLQDTPRSILGARRKVEGASGNVPRAFQEHPGASQEQPGV